MYLYNMPQYECVTMIIADRGKLTTSCLTICHIHMVGIGSEPSRGYICQGRGQMYLFRRGGQICNSAESARSGIRIEFGPNATRAHLTLVQSLCYVV